MKMKSMAGRDIRKVPLRQVRSGVMAQSHSKHNMMCRCCQTAGAAFNWCDNSRGANLDHKLRLQPRRRAARLRCRSAGRSEEHTSELQSLMRISYAVFCLKKNKIRSIIISLTHIN